MNVNFEAIEKAWFKPKKTVLNKLEAWLEEQIKLRAKYKNSLGYTPSAECAYKNCIEKIQELKKENENG